MLIAAWCLACRTFDDITMYHSLNYDSRNTFSTSKTTNDDCMIVLILMDAQTARRVAWGGGLILTLTDKRENTHAIGRLRCALGNATHCVIHCPCTQEASMVQSLSLVPRHAATVHHTKH